MNPGRSAYGSAMSPRFLCCFALLVALSSRAFAQPPEPEPPTGDASGVTPAGAVSIEPAARDDAIRDRLRRVLLATDAISDLDVRVDSGVVFIDGHTTEPEFVALASDLARNTVGVVAVVNRLELAASSPWDLSPARDELRKLWRDVVAALPLVGVGLVVVTVAAVGASLVRRGLQPVLRRRVGVALLADIGARAAGILVLLLGVYLALRIGGLTRLAVTVIGGTGLVGLVVGIAFRGITENFLASLFLSLQQPFREGDLVEVAGSTGYVRKLTSRTTLLTTLDGAQVQIPNATVFGSVIRNFTSSPNRREDFVVGIGYDVAVPHAQEVVLGVLRDHSAVLDHPEPWVLVDRLAPSAVELRVYFWLDGRAHGWLKVRSSVMRLTKRALQDAAISLPDEAREVVFPDGVPLRWSEAEPVPEARAGRPEPPPPETPSTSSEGELATEAAEIEEHARTSWEPDADENLLRRER
jgi:small-conductance mechanosensitive channel